MYYTFKLKPEEAREKLREALNSDEYLQGYGRLCTKMVEAGKTICRYCCLGVACELFIKFEGEDRLQKIDSGDYIKYCQNEPIPQKNEASFRLQQQQASSLLPDIVRCWLGFVSPVGDFESLEVGDKEWHGLAECNDSHLMNFYQIANVIASEPPGLLHPAA